MRQVSESENISRISEGVSIFPPDLDREERTRGGDFGSEGIATLETVAAPTLWQKVFSFPALLGATLIGALAVIARVFALDPDVWWHIKNGQEILATHHWPTTDPYSFSVAGQHWIAFEWMGDVLLATMYRIGGARGMEALMVVLGGAIIIALYTLAAIRSGKSKAAFVATVVVFALAALSFNLRPQMLGYLFLILTLIVLERFRQGKRRAVWALPFLMMVWVNSHGSWIIGLGVIGIYLASGLVEFHLGDIEAHRWNPSDRLQLASVFGLCACATLITPYGAALAKFPFEVASSLPISIANINEWRPMPFDAMVGKLFLASILLIIAFQVTYRFAWRLEEFGLFLFGTIMACLHIRFVLIFVPVFAPVLATILARWVPRYDRPKDRYFLNAALMTAILTFIIWGFPSQADLWQKVGKDFPVAAVEYLDSHPVPGPMYNTYGFGGYLIFSRGPEHKVFMDGRSELYERGGVLADYIQIADIKSGALSVLHKYGFQSCLLIHDDPLATLMAALPDWQKVYEDGTSTIFVRRSASDERDAQISSAAPNSGHGL
jgi:hypothetical protein